VRDGLNAAAKGVPAVALVTEDFWPQGNFVATSFGMPDIPRVQLPHPTAGTGAESMRLIADKVVAEVIAALEGS
jgi:hypothetical protein